MDTGIGRRYGVAIANPSAATISVSAYLNTPAGSTMTTIQIPALNQYVHFVDEIMPVNNDSRGFDVFELSSTSTFNVTGLLFIGNVFSTIVPAILP